MGTCDSCPLVVLILRRKLKITENIKSICEYVTHGPNIDECKLVLEHNIRKLKDITKITNKSVSACELLFKSLGLCSKKS